MKACVGRRCGARPGERVRLAIYHRRWYRSFPVGDPSEPRDLLAERIRRLERRIDEMAGEVAATGAQLGRAAGQLDSLVDLVGRLGRVVDVQGSALHGDESQLERKVGSIEDRVRGLADTLGNVVERLEGMSGVIADALAKPR
jgi:DNA anti-recombination protein RmuC